MDEIAQHPMPQLTPELRAQFLANGRLTDIDHVPVVKFFNPHAFGTWLATELDQDDDDCFCLCRVQHKPNYVRRRVVLQEPFGPWLLAAKEPEHFT